MIQPSTITDFVALCVHSNRMGVVHVKDGKIHDKVYLRDSEQELKTLESYFESVEYVLAFGLGTHRKNLKNMFERVGRSLPDKKYVCVYNWAKTNIGTSTFISVRDYFGIGVSGMEGEYDLSGWHGKDYVLNAEMLAEAAMMMQESCGMELADAVADGTKWKKIWTGRRYEFERLD